MSRFFSDKGDPCVNQKVCLATTSYGNPDAGYTFSIQGSREVLHKAGIQTAYMLLQGNCHVDDARNRIVQEFLETDCTDLVFLDADVTWEPSTLLKLCQLDRDLVGGIYPYRREGKENDLPARLIHGAPIEEDGCVEVEGLPTGFMRIRRSVIEKMIPGAESFISEGRTQHILFQRSLINGTRWGGDLHFCNTWRALGGKIYAEPEMVLGHVGQYVAKGSMASIMRKRNKVTLAYVVQRVREGTYTLRDLTEAIEYLDNPWGAREDVLAVAIKMAKEADGPIIEAGSGLTSILMAAATNQPVYVLEHDPLYAAKLRQMCAEADVKVGLCSVPLSQGWYDIRGFRGLPERFALGLNDGPPRMLGDRMRFFEFLSCDAVIVDDADDPGYMDKLHALEDYTAERLTDRTAVLKKKDTKREAA